MIPVIKLPNGDNYLILDINELYDGDKFSSVLPETFSPPSGFAQLQKDFFNIFSRSDIMNFVNFHNHEQSDKHDDMISYIMEKFIKHYRNFLHGDRDSELFDLR